MKIIRNISIVLVLLLINALAFGQCETYLQKAETLFAQKNYNEAKRQYMNYQECKPNATGIDAKIAECDFLAKGSTPLPANNSNASSVNEKKIFYNENWQGCSQYQAKYYRIAKFDATGKPVGKFFDYYITGELQSEVDGAISIDEINDRNSKFIGYAVAYYKNGVKSHETQYDNNGNVIWAKRYKENGTLIVPRTKTAIGIGSFSGYKCDQAETTATDAFINDGRFIVSKVQNNRYGNNQQTSDDVDYILSANSTCSQYARTEYTRIGNQSIPYQIPEKVNVVITLTNAQTGQIVVNSTYNLNQINRISGDLFPVKFTIRSVNGNKVTLGGVTGGTYFIGDTFNVYEVYNSALKSKIGTIKIDKSGEHKITDGAKEVKKRFEAGAKLSVEK